jgi:hypothetical protein
MNEIRTLNHVVELIKNSPLNARIALMGYSTYDDGEFDDLHIVLKDETLCQKIDRLEKRIQELESK